MTDNPDSKKLKPLRCAFSSSLNVKDFRIAKKNALFLSSLHLTDSQQIDFKFLPGYKKSLRYFLKGNPNIVLGTSSFKKLSYSISHIKSTGSLTLKFVNKKQKNVRKSSTLYFLLKIFLSHEQHNYLNQLSILYTNIITNMELKSILDIMFCTRGLKSLKIIFTNLQNDQQLARPSRKALLFERFHFLKNLERFIILGTNLKREDFQSYVSKLAKLPKLNKFSFLYDSENFSKTGVQDMENLKFRFNTALRLLASKKTLTDVSIVIRSLFKGHEKEVMDATALYLHHSTKISCLVLELSFFDPPIKILENLGRLPQLETLVLKLNTKYSIKGEDFLNGINKLEPLKSKLSTLVLDLSDINLSSIWSYVYQALKSLLINFKGLQSLSLLLGQFSKGLGTTLQALFESLQEIELNIPYFTFAITFEDIEASSSWTFDFLYSLIHLKNLKDLSLDFQFKNLKNRDKRPYYRLVLDQLIAFAQTLNSLSSLKIKLRGLNTPNSAREIVSIDSVCGLTVPGISIIIGDLLVTQKDIKNYRLETKNLHGSVQIKPKEAVIPLKQFLQ